MRIRGLSALLCILSSCANDDQPLFPRGLTPNQWNEISTQGETRCSDGSPYSFFVRPGASNRLIVDFMGGGACWSAETCALGAQLYSSSVAQLRNAIMTLGATPPGLYDHEREDNPFADYSHVIIPYCTADIHWGDSQVTYGSGTSAVTIEHRGATNVRAVLDWLGTEFTAPERILVTGCSAGSYGSILWSAHILEQYPDTHLTQFGDSGAGVITSNFFETSFPSWRAEGAFPSWIPELDPARADVRALAMPDLYAAIASTYSTQRFSQFNTFLDSNQTLYFVAMGGSGADEWSRQMQMSIAEIEERAPNFASFTASGQQHCVIIDDSFYTVSAGGRRMVDWLADFDQDRTMESVACSGDECRLPTH